MPEFNSSGLTQAHYIAFLSNMRWSRGHTAWCGHRSGVGIGLVWASVASGVYLILLRTAIYSVAKKGSRVFKLLSDRPHLKILNEQKITDSPVKQMLNVALGI